MDLNRVDKIVQYALAIAADNDFCARELGRIHLIKYVYLADLAHSERNRGETFTGIPWKFHNFGPWSVEVYKRLEPACLSVGAEKRGIPSTYKDEEFIRWSLENDALRKKLEGELPIPITSLIQWAVHKFGADTNDLLNCVYLTKPMLNSAPGEFLDFSIAGEEMGNEQKQGSKELSVKEQKRRESELKEVKAKIQQKLAQKRRASKKTTSVRPPRYDEVFMAGTEWLDGLAGSKIEEFKGEAFFSPDIWKSRSRFDPELP